MSTAAKTIFVSLRDTNELAEVERNLKEAGYEVVVSPDGSGIVERAITRTPLMIIVDKQLPEVDGVRIFQMLTNNSATAEVPFIIISEDDAEVKGFRTGKDLFLHRPYIWDELFSRIRQTMATAGSARDEDEKVIEGNLAQMSLPDLLQVLELNSKEGVLKVTSEGVEGVIQIKGGMIFNAAIGDVEGEKALYRVLSWSKGRFSFRPQAVKVEQVIKNSSGNLMMEGMRQMDEFEKDSDKFPQRTSLIRAKVDKSTLPKNLKTIIFEIFCHLEYYSMVGDIVDHCSAPDLEVYQSLASLIERGVLEEIKGTEAEGQTFTGLIAPVKALKIKEKLISRWSDMLTVNFGKIYLVATSASALDSFLKSSAVLPDLKISGRVKKDGPDDDDTLGEVGKIKLYGDLEVVLFSVPFAHTMTPVVKSFSSHLMGLFLIVGEDAGSHMAALARFKKTLTYKRRVPVMLINTLPGGGCDTFQDACDEAATYGPDHVFTLGAEGTDMLQIYKTFFDELAREDYTLPSAYAV